MAFVGREDFAGHGHSQTSKTLLRQVVVYGPAGFAQVLASAFLPVAPHVIEVNIEVIDSRPELRERV